MNFDIIKSFVFNYSYYLEIKMAKAKAKKNKIIPEKGIYKKNTGPLQKK